MKLPILLTRDEFREGVFARDSHKCVVCGIKADDAHHIIERRLFPDGGYYLDNGASVCEPCHMKCEQTLISCEELRQRCKIQQVVYPPQYYRDQEIDKWGNPVLPNGNRLRGELFYDESVQKVLEPVLHLFVKYVKYSRTFHVPWSPGGIDKNERVTPSMSHYKGIEIVITEKMDGENTSMYNDYIHARSIDSLEAHPSRSRIKALWSTICSDIPEGWRLSVENCYAKHSILYNNLPDYALLFSIWNDKNMCLSWADTKEWAELFGLKTVPVLYQGVYDEELIKKLHKPVFNGNEREGYVIRPIDSFPYGEFRKWVLKYVRAGHVQASHDHWKSRMIIPNILAV